MNKKRLFILGSCVSRDMLEEVPDEFELVSYLARTSMASVGMPVVQDREARQAVAGLPSPFQQRMLMNDLDKTTIQNIDESVHDILLVDFVDERFNIIPAGRSLFSLSGELEKSSFKVGDRAVLAPCGESFMALWIAGFDRLMANVDSDKVVINRVYWAERFPDGKDASSLSWIRRNNALLQSLYDELDDRWPLKSICYPKDIVLADPNHRWGSAPYHYVGDFYRHAASELRALFGG